MLDEKLSALLDDELEPGEIDACIDRLVVDAGVRQAWSRQHLVRAALRGQMSSEPAMDLAAKVMTALDAQETPATRSNVLAFPRFRPSSRQWAAGLAMAASVAAVALLAPLGLNGPVTPANESAVALGAAHPDIRKVNQLRRAQANAEAERELQQYLLDHEAIARGYGLNSQRRYMRMASPSTTYVAFSPE